MSPSSAVDRSHELRALLGHERTALVEYILRLADFQRLKCWAELGYASPWLFLRKELGLSEAMAGYRAAAAEPPARISPFGAPSTISAQPSTAMARNSCTVSKERARQATGRGGQPANRVSLDRQPQGCSPAHPSGRPTPEPRAATTRAALPFRPRRCCGRIQDCAMLVG